MRSMRPENDAAPVGGRVSVSALCRGWIAVRVPLDDDEVRVMQEAVHRGGCHELVEEEGIPLLDRAVGGEDHRAPLVARPDDLVEVDGLVTLERA